MPKQRITKEMVVNAAFEIARRNGMGQVTVKAIAGKIGCSTQPIYSYCKNMDSLRQDVSEKANQLIQEYLASHIEKDDLFRSTGKAYLQLAEEEPHLFKLFILRQRTGVSSLEGLYQAETNPHVAEYIAEALGVSISQAKQLHMHMLIYTIGIGTILSVATPGIPTKEIYAQQEAAFQAFLNHTLQSKEECGNAE